MGESVQRVILRDLLDTALKAADPARLVPPALPPRPPGMVTVLGAGKASAAMALALERTWGEPMRGLVIVPDGYGAACRHVEIVEAAHPVPDERGLAAARRILKMAQSLDEEDFLLAPISGGGSALMTAPAAGIPLADMQALGRDLLRCGADIGEINTVRRHISAIKGGRLAAAAWPARTLALLLSDVPGDDPAAIASGPTVGDPTSCRDARAILRKYGLAPPASIRAWLDDPRSQTPSPGDERLSRSDWRMIATPARALSAAAARARALGLNVLNLGDEITGEARAVARHHARLARAMACAAHPMKRPALILSGGETSVTVRGKGKGGRNCEYALALAIALGGAGGIHALAADTDGLDGFTAAAGAMITPRTLRRARAAGLSPRAALLANDSGSLFARLGDLVHTGPTLTNVNDFRAILVM